MNENHARSKLKPACLNPYLVGVLLGLTLLASFVILGAGIGASGGIARIASFCELSLARKHTLASEYFGKYGENPLSYYLMFMFVGTFFGALFSAALANRVTFTLEKGRSAPPGLRVALALGGGVLVGFASRLAQGCTSGQALTGSALLLAGSLIFTVCIFVGGYAAAWFVRRQWHD
jgi:hypothetical protein